MSPSRQSLITEFLPKKSKRIIENRNKKCEIIEDEEAKENYIGYDKPDPPGLKMHYYGEHKKRGVMVTKPIKKGTFICEYKGKLIKSMSEAKKLVKKYDRENKGSYMYYFKWNNVSYCIDATPEDDTLGRLINHSRKAPNCKTQVYQKIGKHSKPHLIFIALRDIAENEELLYDYGETDKKTLEANPWLVDS